mmetsp:Transcript_2757/g.4646  ORF Transcript_2757/g.4646 Transcript_2757/m.4646 type:complete len:391 (+) Transcript_2757:228-1400(+)|eukprot:CAMPEP_0198232728 /NCGR_PEP_ID=MMETSP1445-20131203/115881_1 /TAXON_ID=36898 /ORGANISM="Pyramimonas sp., Strain CCMP2087" /LENGTH=390 /DNA_ID=CAMNT_0043913413 /DNA_START=592 /DNA_END=1764 /DNA_ORIENTATION=-
MAAVARWFKVLHRDGELQRVVERVTENLTEPRVLEVFCVAAWATFSSPEGLYDGICTQFMSRVCTDLLFRAVNRPRPDRTIRYTGSGAVMSIALMCPENNAALCDKYSASIGNIMSTDTSIKFYGEFKALRDWFAPTPIKRLAQISRENALVSPPPPPPVSHPQQPTPPPPISYGHGSPSPWPMPEPKVPISYAQALTQEHRTQDPAPKSAQKPDPKVRPLMALLEPPKDTEKNRKTRTTADDGIQSNLLQIALDHSLDEKVVERVKQIETGEKTWRRKDGESEEKFTRKEGEIEEKRRRKQVELEEDWRRDGVSKEVGEISTINLVVPYCCVACMLLLVWYCILFTYEVLASAGYAHLDNEHIWKPADGFGQTMDPDFLLKHASAFFDK